MVYLSCEGVNATQSVLIQVQDLGKGCVLVLEGGGVRRRGLEGGVGVIARGDRRWGQKGDRGVLGVVRGILERI